MKVFAKLTGLALLGLTTAASGQRNFDDVAVKAEQVAPGIAVLFGAGGNMAVSHGEDGTVLIDDQFAPLTGKIEASIAQLGATPVKFLINTHYHGDHTGGNENFGGNGALIFAQENVRARLKAGRDGESPIAPAPKAALPVVTYDEGLRLNLNGDTIDIMFLGGGHTDGDSVVFWREDNVVHMGDLYFKIPGFPFIDTASGGNIFTAIASIDAVIAMTDDHTTIIPGHGPVSNRDELVAYRGMLAEAVSRVKKRKGQGLSLTDTIAAEPLEDFNRGEGFVSAAAFITAIWQSME